MDGDVGTVIVEDFASAVDNFLVALNLRHNLLLHLQRRQGDLNTPQLLLIKLWNRNTRDEWHQIGLVEYLDQEAIYQKITLWPQDMRMIIDPFYPRRGTHYFLRHANLRRFLQPTQVPRQKVTLNMIKDSRCAIIWIWAGIPIAFG